MRRALFLAAMVWLAVVAARAQDPVKVDPKHNKVEFENDQVRVLRFHLGPKESSPMHEHPAVVLVSVTDVRVKVTLADGKTQERTRKAGSVVYRPTEKHAIENLSDKDYESIIIELKAIPVVKWYAHCDTDPWTGPTRERRAEAQNDADAHNKENAGHRATVHATR
jgi:quercetin dioxygenase-like cupin family protein